MDNITALKNIKETVKINMSKLRDDEKYLLAYEINQYSVDLMWKVRHLKDKFMPEPPNYKY